MESNAARQGLRCRVMGILNVTPDSFSDGGRFLSAGAAVERAAAMLEEGASIVDVGGESTRPGAVAAGWKEEWGRIADPLVAIAPLCAEAGALLSVDTYHPETAIRAIEVGATMVNLVYCAAAGEMARICEESGAVLAAPAGSIEDVAHLAERRAPLRGFPALYVDPMVGFGTTRERDLELLRSIPSLSAKCSVLAGVSRKRIVRAATGSGPDDGAGILGGSVGLAVWCALHGASAVRVHDVRETVAAIAAVEAVEGRRVL